MRAIGIFAFGVALVGATASADAQSVISRQIADEPVETVITQGPNGTIITRRPLRDAANAVVVAPTLAPAPRAIATYDTRAVYVPPAAPVVAEDDTVDTITTRQWVSQQPRMKHTRKAATRRAPVVAQTETRAVRRTAQAVRLSPAERRVIYRTIVQEQVVPAPAVTREVVTTSIAPRYWNPPIVAQDDVVDAVTPVVTAPARVAYTVGSVLPASVPLFGVPETVAVRVPATRSYSYAYLGGRAYLVDPVTGAVVADVTE